MLTLQRACEVAVFGVWQLVSDILRQMELRHCAWKTCHRGALQRVKLSLPHTTGGVLSAGLQRGQDQKANVRNHHTEDKLALERRGQHLDPASRV